MPMPGARPGCEVAVRRRHDPNAGGTRARAVGHESGRRRVRAIGLGLTALIAGGLSAVGVAACGTSAFSHTTTVRPIARTTGKPTKPKTTKAATATGTVTQPQVTAVATTTNTGTTTTTGTTGTSTASSLPGYKHPVIQLGDMNTDEQFILGDLYALALRHQGYTVVVSPNIGATAVSQAALQQGSLMVYPEYLNVWDSQVVGSKTRYTSLEAAYQAGADYANRRGWVLLSPTPFSDTLGLVVSAQYARLNHIDTLGALASGPRITLGWPPESDVAGDLRALESVYHLEPGSEQSIAIGSQYSELTRGTIQAAYANTTDPQLTESGYVLLGDPEHVFGFGNVVPVTTEKVIDEEGPAFEQTLDRVDALLTQSAIRGLNYEVGVEHEDPNTVAEQFLQGNGIIPATTYAPVESTTTTSTTGTGTSAGG